MFAKIMGIKPDIYQNITKTGTKISDVVHVYRYNGKEEEWIYTSIGIEIIGLSEFDDEKIFIVPKSDDSIPFMLSENDYDEIHIV